MSLQQKFMQQMMLEDWCIPDNSIVLGVSGGVDSIVLLDLLMTLSKEVRPTIYVAHINHQLREVSQKEQELVENLCQYYDVSCSVGVWEQGSTIESHIERKAREFRYSFFETVMKKTESHTLLTAHHQDDQVETFLMRLLNGNKLSSLIGIRKERPFFSGQLVRPLLTFSKSELYDYAFSHNLSFLEDESNESLLYYRNRVRHQILPLLKKENPQLTSHVIRLQEELHTSFALSQRYIQPHVNECLMKEKNCWEIDLRKFDKKDTELQDGMVRSIIRDFSEETSTVISYQLEMTIKKLFQTTHAYQRILMPKDWAVEKNYEKVKFYKIVPQDVEDNVLYRLLPGEGVFLSETEWLGFLSEETSIPEEIQDWEKIESMWYQCSKDEVVVRKPQPGDQFIYNKQGQRKKISRYFIDEKIPRYLREKAWVILDNKNNIKWLLPFRESYLSIRNETAKIRYKLVYFHQKKG